MRLGIFNHGWWTKAAETLGYTGRLLPIAQHPSGNAYAADVNSRMNNGRDLLEIAREESIDLLVDNGGTGLSFIPDGSTPGNVHFFHEVVGKPLCSHFIDPLVTAFQGLPWGVVWTCLQNANWFKAVWDKAHAEELRQFGVPHVSHVPMAAPDRDYDATPLDPDRCRPVVSFVGGQNTSYFTSNMNVPSGNLLAGTLSQAVRSNLPDATFYEVYHDLYSLGERVFPQEPMETGSRKTLNYFSAKLFYHAALCIRNRDRFVVFLKKKLGDRFELIGRGWDSAYGLATHPPIPSTDDYFRHFREAAININLVNGNAETGLNMRHFEITAAGGFLLCYDQSELSLHFDVGKECAVFHDENDLLDKIDYYLTHSAERCAIAQAGQRRTLGQHLYSHRLQSILRSVSPLNSNSRPSEPAARHVQEPSLAKC